jgi:hypothetical protein
MFRILSIETKPFDALRYLNASPRGRAEVARLPFFRGRVDALPAGCDALVLASDLQGMASPAWGEPAALVGVAVARAIEELALGRTGVILAGDLFSVPEANKRGGFGDVSSVWHAFADFAAWVAGVAGNHDDVSRVRAGHVLDGTSVELGGITIGGVGYIAGNSEKKGRRTEDEQLDRIGRVTSVDMLVLHEGPDESAAIDEATKSVPLVVCGHHHHDILRGSIVNVHERVLVLSD